jgi:hypothetical protein
MEAGQFRGRSAGQIDYPVRGAQILLTLIYAKFTYFSLGTDSFVSGLFSSIGLLLIIGAVAHGVATGTADSSGIHYRRYFRQRTVAWADVLGIQWIKSWLKVSIKGRGKRKKTLVFLLNPLKAEGGVLGAPFRFGGSPT